ncbi:hypothetical protein M407DRAFT_226289 [Tulasnella calospora MUT 4182]|uniref:Uncharacterized protein n=1 Tax=Tulasnella calospora MUT 4182 TaxID=1051891 RepID=A0A0C3QQF9_9AGAM|nr:hypothetical protein M407DRAFT_226289 [Tulasnella calospora MUT 4182]
MDSETNYDALRSTLDELAYLLIEPSRLTILKDSEVGSGGYGEVCLATLDETSKVAVKQLRIVQAKGIRLEIPNLLPVRLPRDEKLVDDTAPEISILSKSQLNGGAYHQVKFRSRDAHGWVLEDAPELEVVLRLHEDAFDIAISPNGKWLAANFPSKRKLWSLENPSSPPLVLPGTISTSYEWSPDSRYLASFDTLALHIWSIESQSSKGRFNGRPTWSAAWFSNGEALAVDSGGSVSIMSSKSGRFQMGSDWMSVTTRANQDNSPMATLPIDRVGGRRIVVMPGCRQPTSSWFLGTVLGYNRGGPTDTLTRTSHDHLVRHVTVSRNGEFVLLSHVYTFPTLWRLNIPDDGGGTWDIQITLTYSFTIPLGLSSRAFVCWASLSGDDDEWVISATKEGQIVIWDTQSSQPRQVVEGLPRVDSGKRPETMDCSAEDKNGPLILLYGHNSREVVIWKWWGKLFERV